MPDLEVTITLRLRDVDARRLRAAVEAVTGGANDNAAYKGHLAGLVQAAAMEYVEMVSGTRRFSRMGDLEEHRVFALSRALLDGRPMDDRAVSRLLQLTPTRSRSLVNSMAARYRFELDEVLMEQLKELLTTEDFAEQLKKKPAKRKAVEFECHYRSRTLTACCSSRTSRAWRR